MPAIGILNRKVKIFNGVVDKNEFERRTGLRRPFDILDGMGVREFATLFLLGAEGKVRNANQIAQRIRQLTKQGWGVQIYHFTGGWRFYIEKAGHIGLRLDRAIYENELGRILSKYEAIMYERPGSIVRGYTESRQRVMYFK